MSQPRPLRSLLPAGSQHSSTASPTGTLAGPGQRRQGAACSSCRANKVACDGRRPSCARCQRRGRQCEYATRSADETLRAATERQLGQLRAELAQHQDLVRQLCAVPDEEAAATLQRLRAAHSLAAASGSGSVSVSVPSPARGPSVLRTARAVLPPTKTRTEFELAVRHGAVYTLADAGSRPDIAAIFARSPSRTPAHLATHTLLRDGDGGDSETTGSAPPSPLSGVPAARPAGAPPGPLRSRAAYCDARLRRLDIGYWTSVPISNEFAASLLSVYLENEHPIVGAFDTETFLDALVAPRLDYCSPLLVSCVLAIACQCYTAIDPRAGPLALAFLREATAQWRSGAVPDSAPSLAALTTLCMATMSQGQDGLSVRLLRDVRAMAERLGFCGASHADADAAIARFRRLAPDALRAAAHAAWGAYAWLSVHASYYGDEPVTFPPVLPIPGVASATWPTHPQPAYMGHVFGAWCRLWTIDQATRAVYQQHGTGAVLAHAVPLAFVEQQYQQLLAWAASTLLTSDLAAAKPGADHDDNDSSSGSGGWSPHVLVLHAYFHIIVLDLLRPFLQQPRMYTLSSPDSSPQAVFDASFRQLRVLLVRYCASRDPRLYNFYLNGAVLHVVHVVLHGGGGGSGGDNEGGAMPADSPPAMSLADRRFYLQLCMGWMQEVYVRYAVIGKAAQAHMSLAVAAAAAAAHQGGPDSVGSGGSGGGPPPVITVGEARGFLDEMQRRGRHHDLAGVALSCVVDFDSALASRSAGRAQDLARRFDELVLFDELTTGVIEEA